MKNCRFFLTVMTIFAVLFVVTFIFYRSTLRENAILRNEIRAFKYLYEGDIEKFIQNLKKINAKDVDINFYIKNAVKFQVSKAESEIEKRNYDVAYKILLNVYDYSQDEEQRYYIAYLLGKVLNKKEEYDEAYNFLEIFLSGKFYGFSKDALVELAVSAKKLGRTEDLKVIEEYFKKDPVYYKKFQEVIR
ncbi:MAG: hypothetical protein J7L34_08730 [Thermotogaceae bacterium]|nr:hypothetical protein [Thermotogaceae bacterium]